MRMTNKIMQNNSLYNINNNKIMQDKLSTMMSTQKKITRPSDDPVIAIRALRLRTSVSEMTQYYEKNAPDAESWLDVTAGALDTVTEVVTNMIKLANRSANKEFGSEDLQVFVEQFKALRNEFYSTGNTDYAGRYVFTGYRTDTTLSFTEEVETEQKENPGYPSYKITEQVGITAFDQINYTWTGELAGLNKNNYLDANGVPKDITEQKDVQNGDMYRLRLSYDVVSDDAANAPVITYKDKAGVDQTLTVAAAQIVSSSDDPYKKVLDDPKAMIFVPDTGELLFGKDAYNDIAANVTQDTEFQVTYTKNEWKKGDMRPEHYFACEKEYINDAKEKKEVKYNQEYLTKGNKNNQAIEYDVGYNQKIRVNTTADEVFNLNLDRDIDDLERALADLVEIDATKKDIELKFKEMDEGNPNYSAMKKQYEAANKAYDYIRENIHNMFEHTVTKMQGYLDATDVAITDNGTRSQRLDLISNRLMDQRTNFKTLQSENEDIDIAEVVIQLTSTELTYNSALMATGKIMQTSLMNYI